MPAVVVVAAQETAEQAAQVVVALVILLVVRAGHLELVVEAQVAVVLGTTELPAVTAVLV